MGSNQNDWIYGLASDGGAGVYVVQRRVSNDFCYLMRFNHNGLQLWSKDLGLWPAPDPRSLCFDGTHVFAGGWIGTAKDADSFLGRYDDGGGQVWSRTFGPNGGLYDEDYAVAVVPDGNSGVIVVGRRPSAFESTIARFDPQGNQLWYLPIDLGQGSTDLYAAATDGAGGAFIVGRTGPTWYPRIAVMRYAGDGQVMWTAPLDPELMAHGAAEDGAGGVYVVGQTLWGDNQNYDRKGFVSRYDAQGVLLWRDFVNTPERDDATACAPDGRGGVFVVGETRGDLGAPNAGETDVFVVHYDSAGARGSAVQFGTSTTELVRSAAADGDDGVFVAGITYGSLGGGPFGGMDAFVARVGVVSPWPNDPTDLAASEPLKGVANLIWDDNADNEIGYRVRREQFLQGIWKNGQVVATLPADTTTFAQSPGQGFWRYQVQAFTGEQDSAWTPLVAVPAAAPSGLAITKVNGSARLDWTDNSNFETNFLIQRQQKVANKWTNLVNVATAAKNTVSHTNSPGAGTWRYRLRAGSKGGNSLFTPWVTATLP